MNKAAERSFGMWPEAAEWCKSAKTPSTATEAEYALWGRVHMMDRRDAIKAAEKAVSKIEGINSPLADQAKRFLERSEDGPMGHAANAIMRAAEAISDGDEIPYISELNSY